MLAFWERRRAAKFDDQQKPAFGDVLPPCTSPSQRAYERSELSVGIRCPALEAK